MYSSQFSTIWCSPCDGFPYDRNKLLNGSRRASQTNRRRNKSYTPSTTYNSVYLGEGFVIRFDENPIIFVKSFVGRAHHTQAVYRKRIHESQNELDTAEQ
jgi:hypothetical protein